MGWLDRATGNLSGASGVSVSVDTSGFHAALRAWWAMGHPDLKKILEDEVLLLAKALALYSPPFALGGGKGLSNAAFQVGKRRILREANILFKPLWMMPSVEIADRDDPQIFMKVRRLKIRNRNKVGGARGEPMQSFYRDKDPNRGFERMKRYLKGQRPKRISRYVGQATYPLLDSKREEGRIKGNRKEIFYVDDVKSIKDAAQPGIQRIGRLKAGWADAAFSITSRHFSGMPEWVRRNSGLGKGLNRLADQYDPQAELIHTRGNIWKIGDKKRTVQKAFEFRRIGLEEKIKAYLTSLTSRRSPLNTI